MDRTTQAEGMMPKLTWGNVLVVVVLTGLAPSNAQVAAPERSAPDFASNMAAWVNINPDFLPVPGAPGPTRNDPAYPYVGNQEARRAGI